MNSSQILAQSASFPWQCLAATIAAAATVAVVGARLSKARLRRAFEQNQRDQAQLRMVVAQMPAVVWTTDTELRFTSCEGAGLVGLDGLPPQMVGIDFYTYFQSTDPTLLPIAKHLAALRGESSNYEFFWNNRTFLVRCEPLRDAAGKVIGAVGVGTDISARKAVEQALATSEAKNRALLEAIPDVMFRLRSDGTLIEFIDKLLAPSENYAGQSVCDVFPPAIAGRFLDAARRALDDRATQKFEYETGPGHHVRHFEARVVSCGPDEVLVIVRKVTPWRHAAMPSPLPTALRPVEV